VMAIAVAPCGPSPGTSGDGAGNLQCRTDSGIPAAGTAYTLPMTSDRDRDRAAILAHTAAWPPRGQVVTET
jgi:hypothetical protein